LVPPVIGLPEERAVQVLAERGLRSGTRSEQPSGEERGTVIAQAPASGVQVRRNVSVDLTVAAARSYLVYVISGALAVLGVGIVSVVARQLYKSPGKLRAEITLKPRRDPGKSHVDPGTGVDSGLEISLRPLSDAGRQAVSGASRIIDEDG
jgi:hypothetical protein